jgi:prepilin-type N-terminal cleavage/methylation domain-containing protein/prepilin-type processing-associated H-X9-DG protein
MKRCHRAGFTLLELLVVTVIIGLLAALLMPSLSGARQRAQATKCLGHLRQIGLAATLYADENGDILPGSQHEHQSWLGSLQKYLAGIKTYRCPLDRVSTRFYSYAINDFLTPHPYGASTLDYSRRGSLLSPSDTIYMAECTEDYVGSDHFHFADASSGGYGPDAFAYMVAANRHQSGANYLFVDSHVEWLGWTAARVKLTQSGSRFVHPAGNP